MCFVGWSTATGFMAVTAAVAQQFLFNRTLALGISFAGGSLGTMLYPLIFRAIVPVYTLRGHLLLLAAFKLNFVVVAFLFYAGRHENLMKIFDKNVDITHKNDADDNTQDKEEQITSLETSSEVVTETHAQTSTTDENPSNCQQVIAFLKTFITLKFLAMCLWYFTYVYAVFGYLMYFPPYAKELLLSDFQMAALLSIYGATDLVSRIAVGFLGGLSWVSIYTLTSINMIITGILTILLPTFLRIGAVYPVFIGHMVVMGLFAGGIYGLLGSIAVDAVGTAKAGTAIGVAAACFGIAILVPPNIYGNLIS